MNDLENHELDEVSDINEIEEEERKERFKITDTEKLSWALRKIKSIDSKVSEVNDLANAEKDRIDEWKDSETKTLENSKSFFEGLIAEYLLNRKNEDEKFKSEKTPFGKAGFKKVQDKYQYTNEEKVIEYLENNGYEDLYKVEKKPKKADIKKKFPKKDKNLIDPDTGEIIEGIEVIEQEDVFDIKPS